MTTASSPSPRRSWIHAPMLAFAQPWLSSTLPMWCVSAPQHPCPLAITTSQPSRVSSRMVAALISGSSTFCAHPVSSATRRRRWPSAGKTCGSSCSAGGWMTLGARLSIARSRPGISRRAGRPSFAPKSARRKRLG